MVTKHVYRSPSAVQETVTPSTRVLNTLGWLPELSVIAACGIFLIALAYSSNRLGIPGGQVMRWLGLLVLFAPIAMRLSLFDIQRHERIGLLLYLGLGLYLVKVLYSPVEFQFSDELQQWRTAQDIVQTKHLFTYNYVLPISPFYPGLQNVTIALSTLSRISVVNAGMIIIGVARIISILALFRVYERISRSSYIGGLATLLYMTNPHFLFMNSYYIYQALALPLSLFVLLSVSRIQQGDSQQVGWLIAALLGSVAVAATHHVTSYVLGCVLVLWTIVALFVRPYRPQEFVPWLPAAVSVGSCIFWISIVAPTTAGYLLPPFENLGRQIVLIMAGGAQKSQYHPPTSSIYEQIFSAGAIVLIVLGLVAGLRQIWFSRRFNAITITLCLGTLGYFASLVMRFVTSDGAELTGRSWAFLFLMVAYVVGWGCFSVIYRPQLILTICLSLIFIGGITSGWPPSWAALPGSYLVEASERSVDTQGVQAATWAVTGIGPGNRIATNFTNALLMGSYGQQDPVFGVADAFLSPAITKQDIYSLRKNDVRYLVVDLRISRSTPVRGFYFYPWEPLRNSYTQPVDRAVLLKFARNPKVHQVFDSGDIVIYDIKGLLYE